MKINTHPPDGLTKTNNKKGGLHFAYVERAKDYKSWRKVKKQAL